MPDVEGDCVGPQTAPVFDDRLYLTEALLVQDCQNEEDLDAQLALAARHAGIEDPDLFLIPRILDISTATSTMSLQSEQRSSMSIDSRETQSSTFTSFQSRDSRDKSPISRAPPSLMRASFSLDRSDVVPDSPGSTMHHRHSTSGYSTSMSLQSNTPSVRMHAPKKSKRASALFSMFRKEPRACSSRSHHNHHFKAQSRRLECGHSLSKYAIRVHVQEALEKKDGAAPACCGQPLPRDVLEIVLTNAEIDLVANNLSPSLDTTSLRDSGYSENGFSSVDLPRVLHTNAFVTGPSTVPATPTCEMNVEEEARLMSALRSETFKRLKMEQREQFQRISAFEANQRKRLSADHQQSLRQLAARLDTSRSEKAMAHAKQLERLDEFQLMMEHDLRNAQATETQNVATALKHMEAYCLGPNPAHPEITYAVTEEDRMKLERQRTIQEKLPAKHDSAINVLRAKQERDAKIKILKQQAELEELEADYDKEKRALELQYIKDCTHLDALMQTRRSKALRRWNLKFEIWRKGWEKEFGMPLPGRIPHEEWPEPSDMDASLDSSTPHIHAAS